MLKQRYRTLLQMMSGDRATPVATSLVVTPASGYKMPQNEVYPFSVQVLDQFGNPFVGAPATVWSEILPDGSTGYNINGQANFFDRLSASSLATNPNGTVSSWVTTNGRNFAQATGSKQPLLEKPVGTRPHVKFDGVDDYINCVFAGLTYPFTMYWVVALNTWVANSRLWEATNGSSNGTTLQQTSTPQVGLFGTAQGPKLLVANSPPLTTFGILTTVFNGASSKIQWNNLTADTSGNPGAALAPAGMRIGAESTAGLAPVAMSLRDLVIRLGADDLATQTAHKNQLAWEHGITI